MPRSWALGTGAGGTITVDRPAVPGRFVAPPGRGLGGCPAPRRAWRTAEPHAHRASGRAAFGGNAVLHRQVPRADRGGAGRHADRPLLNGAHGMWHAPDE